MCPGHEDQLRPPKAPLDDIPVLYAETIQNLSHECPPPQFIACQLSCCRDACLSSANREKSVCCPKHAIAPCVNKAIDGEEVRFCHGCSKEKVEWFTNLKRTCYESRDEVEKAIMAEMGKMKKLGNGADTYFWEDLWHGDMVLKQRYPRLYALEVKKTVDVASKLSQENLTWSFRRAPRSGVEQDQLTDLTTYVKGVVLGVTPDRWYWTLDGSGEFSVASARKVIDDNRFSEVSNQTRWIKAVPIKVNIHVWKVRMDCLPTRLNISRRGIDIPSILCPVCGSVTESSSHLFFDCLVAKDNFRKICRWWEVDFMEVHTFDEWVSWIVNLRIPIKHKREGTPPDDVTFVGAILACTDGGMVDKGQELFKSMNETDRSLPESETHELSETRIQKHVEFAVYNIKIATRPGILPENTLLRGSDVRLSAGGGGWFLARASLRSAGLKGVESRGILLVFRPNSALPLLRAGSLYVVYTH
ncbi:RNA-directed DNA polymerase, eukaryota, reverse transcriptase zinc-binding domain protein [Tanacetum coccineum]